MNHRNGFRCAVARCIFDRPLAFFFRGLLGCLFLAVATPGTLAQTDESTKPVALFDGKTLDGWEGDPRFWRVEDGAITGQTTAETPLEHNTFLIWRGGELRDFELRLKFRIEGGNSGIQYRSQDLGEFRVHGYQADIDSDHQYIGILYDEGGRGILANRMLRIDIDDDGQSTETGTTGDETQLLENIRKEDWNEYVITARGNRLTQAINGFLTVDVRDAQKEQADDHGILALQIHTGPPMKVQFKDIELRSFDAEAPANYPAETILHYVRSNQDGSNPEKISVFLESPTRVAVFKRRSPGTDAALVLGHLDPSNHRAEMLIGGRLKPDGTQDPRAWLRHDLSKGTLSASFEGPDATPVEKLQLQGNSPWRMFDFDWADWNALAAGKPPSREDFSVELAMAWPDAKEGEPLIRHLGVLRATYAGEEFCNQRPTVRFNLSGEFLKESACNAVWLDAVQGFVVTAMLTAPNHPGYRDFCLALTGVESGQAAWKQLLESHFDTPRE